MFVLLAAWAAFAPVQDPPPLKVALDVENIGRQGAEVSSEIKKVAGILDASVSGSKVTITIDWNTRLALSALKEAVARVKPDDEAKPLGIKAASIRLEGYVDVDFTLEGKEAEKAGAALKGHPGIVDHSRAAGYFALILKSPAAVTLGDLSKAVAKANQKEEAKALELVRDVTWRTPEKNSPGGIPWVKPPRGGG